jgi:hypothetical protein
VTRSEGRRQLGRPRPIWEDNIKIEFLDVVWGHRLDHLAQDKNR